MSFKTVLSVAFSIRFISCMILHAEDNEQNCMCVPFWQCKEDNSGFNEDGINLFDIRSSFLMETPARCTGDFDVCCKVQCGRRGSDNLDLFRHGIFQGRILGKNNEVRFAEFPWMLGITHQGNYRCGASLIHPKVALTAAHCVPGIGSYAIRAGEWNWENDNEPLGYQDRIPQKIIIHPRYNPASLRNDIALIILEQPFKLAENVGIACLPPQNMNFDHSKCIATGWGKNSYKSISKYQSILKKVTLPIIPRGSCSKSLQELRLGRSFVLHHSFICAGGEINKDTCKGDGGSPLVCPIDGEDYRYEQVGIVSWGLTCGVRNTPGVYVNVALFSDWIDKQMIIHKFDTSIYRY